MALAANRTLTYHGEQIGARKMRQLTATTIYEGALVGVSGGYARPLVAQDAFQGVASRQSINAGASGTVEATVIAECYIEHAVAGVTAVTDQGAAVYASDDGTLTLTSTSNTLVGSVALWLTGTSCIVFLQAAHRRIA